MNDDAAPRRQLERCSARCSRTISAGEFDRLAEFMTDDLVFDLPYGPDFLPNPIEGLEPWNQMQLMTFKLFSSFALELDEVHECLDPDELVAEYHSECGRHAQRQRVPQSLHRRAAVPRRQDLALARVPQSAGHRRAVSARDRRGHVRSGLRGRARRVRAELRRRARARRVALDQRRRPQRRRPLGRTPRRGADATVGARHDRVRVLVHEGRGRDRDDVGGRPRARRSRRAGRARTGPSSRPRARATFRCAGCSRTKPGCPRSRTRMPHGSLSDWDAMTTALAAQAPWWEPGTAHGYHGVTFGHLIGEVLRRATGRDCGELIRDELAAPLGVELCMPLPAALDARTADLDRRAVARRHVLRSVGPEDVARSRRRSATRPTATIPRTA